MRTDPEPMTIIGNKAESPVRRCPLEGRLLALAVFAVLPLTAFSSSLPDGDSLMQAVADRDLGESRVSDMTLRLTNRHGNTRTQETVTYRKYYGEERRTVIFYTEPSNVRGTAFLTHDYPDPDVDDDQWLYLPAMRKVRRISASSRGDYFLGTDLTYEDVKNENRMPPADYHFETLARETVDGQECIVVEAVPVSDEIAEELGYGRVKVWVDPDIHVIRRATFRDVAGNRLKQLQTRDIRQVDGIWTVHRMEVNNVKTGHGTVLEFDNVRYNENLDDSTFTRGGLRRGRF